MSQHQPKIEAFFNQLRKDRLELVDQFYSPDVFFQDPLGDIQGRDKLRAYYKNLYESVLDIRFEFRNIGSVENRAFAPWIMHLRAPKLKRAQWISVAGISEIEFDSRSGQATYHRDYFDMGAFIYEHIPVLGSVVRAIRGRLAHE